MSVGFKDGLHPVVMARLEGGLPPRNSTRGAALLVQSALYEELEAGGHHVAADGVVVRGESFSIAITSPDGAASLERLVLVVTHRQRLRSPSRWTCHMGKPLAPQVRTLRKRLETAAEEVLRRRAWRRAEERRMRRMAARYRWDLAAAERPERLRSMTDDWHEARRARVFMDHLEAHLGAHPSGALASWLLWARRHVDDVDPFSAANLEELERHAALLARPKRGRMEPDEEELRMLGALDDYL